MIMTGKKKRQFGKLRLTVEIIQAADLKLRNNKFKTIPDPYVVLLIHPEKKVYLGAATVICQFDLLSAFLPFD